MCRYEIIVKGAGYTMRIDRRQSFLFFECGLKSSGNIVRWFTERRTA